MKQSNPRHQSPQDLLNDVCMYPNTPPPKKKKKKEKTKKRKNGYFSNSSTATFLLSLQKIGKY